MAEQTTAYIGLGSNLGDREGCIDKALKLLGEADGIEVCRVSDFIETRPLAGADQANYINAVAEIRTTRGAEDLFGKLAEIESSLGRVRGEKWSARTIDLDLLLFGSKRISTAELTVPHAEMHLRSFVLKGLCQLNPGLVHPVIGESVAELAARLNGGDFFLDASRGQLVSIAGIIGVGKTTLAEKLASVLNAELLCEPYDTNPFMPEVYAGRKELALDSQLYFLTHRIDQIGPDRLGPGQIAVTDYIFDKELIYATRLLSAEQFDLYERTFQPLAETVTTPAVVVYLHDSAQRCLERIHRRRRSYEQRIRLDFLEKLAADYDRLFEDWKQSPLIRLSTAKFDCNSQSDTSAVAEQIRAYIKF